MLDFEIQRFTRRCAATHRELRAGESFYSVLVPQEALVVRRDYAADAWQGPPDEALGWWKSQVPDPRANRLRWAPNDVLLHYFQQIHEDADRRELCYVLTLLMLRRRIFRLEASQRDGQQGEVLLVYCARNETEYRVAVAMPDAPAADRIQQELAELLFARIDGP